MELDDVADELYALPPEEFIAARKEREAEARAGGDRAMATEIAGLAKPSTAAWVCNLLARNQPDEVAGLVELGDLLREAQENLAGDELRALDVQRRKLLAALTRQARALAYEHGHSVTTTVAGQVEETLRAAMTDPDAGQVLVAGRLTTALSYSGMGTGRRPDLHVVPPPRTREKPAEKAPAKKAPAGKAATRASGRDREAERQAAERAAAERAEAERRAAEERRRKQLEEARAAADEAAADAEQAAAAEESERTRTAELREREEDLAARVEELTEELARVREECTRVGSELGRAERREKAAARRAAEAARASDRARSHLEELENR